ncbi:hypothetical protein CW368_04105 [Actinomycetales bacterium SN12]|nr:hypothetical protein CW368_04105 [Actinomycetales bacterium SN12]
MGAFAAQVQLHLDDARTGLGMLDGSSPADAAQIVDQLQQDAERLAETATPSEIEDDWSSSVGEYQSALTALRSAVDKGADTSGATDAARAMLQTLRDLLDI